MTNTLHNVFDLLKSTGLESAFAISLPSELLSINGEHFIAHFKNWCRSATPLIHASVEVESLMLPDLVYGGLPAPISFPRYAFVIKNCKMEIIERWVSEIEANTSLNPNAEEVVLCQMDFGIALKEPHLHFDATVEINISEYPRLLSTI